MDDSPETGVTDENVVVFSLDGHRLALPLETVDRVVRMVAVTPLPGGPDSILGVIDIAGKIVPVIDLRRRLNLPRREPVLSDQLLIVTSGHRTLALPVDRVEEVLQETETVTADQIFPGLGPVEGIGSSEKGLVVIHDPGRLFIQQDADLLDSVLTGPLP